MNAPQTRLLTGRSPRHRWEGGRNVGRWGPPSSARWASSRATRSVGWLSAGVWPLSSVGTEFVAAGADPEFVAAGVPNDVQPNGAVTANHSRRTGRPPPAAK